MKRREFLFAGGMSVVCADATQAKTESKQIVQPDNSLVICRDNMVGIITSDVNLIKWGGASCVFVINRKAYDIVNEFVRHNKHWLDSLMISESPGTVYYWENNYHDKITQQLLNANPEYTPRDIGNALWVLGY